MVTLRFAYDLKQILSSIFMTGYRRDGSVHANAPFRLLLPVNDVLLGAHDNAVRDRLPHSQLIRSARRPPGAIGETGTVFSAVVIFKDKCDINHITN